MSAPIVLAHPGHWAVQLLYLAPLLALVILLVVGRIRERRERRAGSDPED